MCAAPTWSQDEVDRRWTFCEGKFWKSQFFQWWRVQSDHSNNQRLEQANQVECAIDGGFDRRKLVDVCRDASIAGYWAFQVH